MNSQKFIYLLLVVIFITTGFLFLALNIFRPVFKNVVSSKLSTINQDNKFDLGIAFPPFANQEQIDFSLQHLKALNVTKIRLGETWALREPTKGNFNWGPLDQRVQAVIDNSLSLLLTIHVGAPNWACSEIKNDYTCVPKNKQDFRNYIRELVQRYSNKIDKIMFENEFESHWAGSKEDLVTFANILYEEVKKYSPETKVVMTSFTRGLLNNMLTCQDGLPHVRLNSLEQFSQDQIQDYCHGQFLKDLSDAKYIFKNIQYDHAALHLYDEVDKWDDYLNKFKTLTSKPVLITEMGGPNLIVESCQNCPHPYTDQYQSDQLKKYFEKLEAMDVKEVYYFKLVEGGQETTVQHQKSGLITKDLKTKPAYDTFKNYNN